MISRSPPSVLFLALSLCLWATASTSAFQAPRPVVLAHARLLQKQQNIDATTALSVFGGGKKKKQQEDLSSIETRDMTREEMLALNKENEDVMNAELAGMTIFSLIISVPLLYLAWVGFFSETAEIAGEFSDMS